MTFSHKKIIILLLNTPTEDRKANFLPRITRMDEGGSLGRGWLKSWVENDEGFFYTPSEVL
jgi:hypothetical protein